MVAQRMQTALRLAANLNLITHPPTKRKPLVYSILVALPVMLNVASYIICRYQTEQCILKRF
jgi:hypothetical protein